MLICRFIRNFVAQADSIKTMAVLHLIIISTKKIHFFKAILLLISCSIAKTIATLKKKRKKKKKHNF